MTATPEESYTYEIVERRTDFGTRINRLDLRCNGEYLQSWRFNSSTAGGKKRLARKIAKIEKMYAATAGNR